MGRRLNSMLVAGVVMGLLAGCGGGGGGGGGGGAVPPPPAAVAEGSVATPVQIALATPHAGSVPRLSASYYKTPALAAGVYKFAVTGASAALELDLGTLANFSDAGVTMVCGWFNTVRDEVCSVTLTAATYYFKVIELSGYADSTPTITITKLTTGGTSDGTSGAPIGLTVATPFTTAKIGSNTSSFYSFLTTTAGNYTITVSNATSKLSWSLFSVAGFTTPVGSACIPPPALVYGPNCGIALGAATTYYLRVDQTDSVANANFTLLVSGPGVGGVAEGSFGTPIVITRNTPRPS